MEVVRSRWLMSRFFNRENGLVIVLCLILILLIIVTSDTSPTFIYQGF